jgi:phosphatidylserine/phosphatidylglycerophosphate/cardiolipin synthase-like enzyme
MLALTTTTAVLAALRDARTISLVAYTLRPGRVEDALLAAARRGAHVAVRLEGHPYAGADGALLKENRVAVDVLARAGADARLVDTDGSGEPPLHAKAIVADDTLFLDDRNWPDDDADTIVRDDFAHDRRMVEDAVRGSGDRPGACFTIRKRDSLASEARLFSNAEAHDDAIVETESFGKGNRVYRALDALGKAGAAPRVLVSSRDLQDNANERTAIARLQADGVQVRAVDADEKFALAGTRGWLGSTNATVAFNHPDQLDWGARTDDPTIVAHLRRRFEERWKQAVTVA